MVRGILDAARSYAKSRSARHLRGGGAGDRRRRAVGIGPSICVVAVAVWFARCGDAPVEPPANRPPISTSTMEAQTIAVGETVTVDASEYFADPDGDELDFVAETSDADLVESTTSGSVVTVSGVAKGMATVIVTAYDAEGLSAQQSFGVTVPNRGPVAKDSIAAVELQVGDSAGLDGTEYFSDPDGDTLTFAAVTSEVGVASVRVSGNSVAIVGLAKGVSIVTVMAEDPDGMSAQLSFGVTVPNRGPLVRDSIVPVNLFRGDSVELNASEYFEDPDGDSLTFAVTVAEAGVASASVSASKVLVSAVGKGTTTITLDARDSEGLSVSQSFAVIVPNRPPFSTGSLPGLTVFVGASQALNAAEYLMDPDGDSLSFAAETADTSVIAISVSGSMVTVSAVAKGTGVVNLTAHDPDGLSAVQNFAVEVPNRSPVAVDSIHSLELFTNDTARLDVSRYFEDPDGDSLRFEAGSSDVGVTTVSVAGSLATVAGVGQGTASVTFTAVDPDAMSALQSLVVVVPNRSPIATDTLPELTVVAGQSIEWDLSIYFDDPDGDTLTYVAESSDPRVVTASVSGSIMAALGRAEGEAALTVTASDPDGLVEIQTAQVTVEVIPVPTIVTVTPTTVSLEALGDTVRLGVEVVDQEGRTMANADVSWSSGEATVVSVNHSGLATAVGNGETMIVATAGAISDTAHFRIQQAIDSVTVSPSPGSTVVLGESLRLDAMALDKNGHVVAGTEFTWMSSDRSVARVDRSGLVTTLKVGRSRVSARVGDVSGASTIIVVKPGQGFAYLTQAVQSPEGSVPLVAGEEALLRVFVTATKSNQASLPSVRARFLLAGAEYHVADISASPGPIPREVDEGDLHGSINARIPQHVIRPGMEMVLEIDPQANLDPALGVVKRIPRTGRLSVAVRTMPAFNLTIVPFLWEPDPDSLVLATTQAMARNPQEHPLLDMTRTLLPIRDMRVTAHNPVVTTLNNSLDLLGATQAIQVMEGGEDYYMGTMTGTFEGIDGLALQEVPVFFSKTDLGDRSEFVIAHELGHNMSLLHTPGCKSGYWTDHSYPHRGGSIGFWGFDFAGDSLVTPDTGDLMSYCSHEWVSDYHFRKALQFRLVDEGASYTFADASPNRSLVLWGGVGPDGNPYLRPSFVLGTPPSLPQSGGEYSVIGRSGDGRALFDVNFNMDEVVDGLGGASFAFALPVRQGWSETLATITLEGPGGRVTLAKEVNMPPMVIVRDSDTGRIQAILQGVVDVLSLQSSFEVHVSRGIPTAEAWR